MKANFVHSSLLLKQKIVSNRFSNYQRMVRAMAYAIRFVNLLIGKAKKGDPLSQQELRSAENLIFRQAQFEGYPAEMVILERNKILPVARQRFIEKPSPLHDTTPYLDADNVLRMKSRIDGAREMAMSSRRPIVLPRDNRITWLVLQKYHKEFYHRNHETVITNEKVYGVIESSRLLGDKLRKVRFLLYKIAVTTVYRIARPQQRLKKDVRLLQSALGFNPWQLGHFMWKEVVSELAEEYGDVFTVRALKNRVDLLIDKFKKKQLKYCSGMEEQTTKRGELLEAIIAIKEEENATINTEVNCDDDCDEIIDADADCSSETKQSKAKKRKLERLEADNERASYVDEAPGPSAIRTSRQRLSVEEEVMMEKHKHEMELEKQKIEIEKLRIASEERLAEKRLILEHRREERLLGESQRRDDIAKSQIELQATMMAMMRKFMD
ncbi:hypothetical protein Bhyg_04640, partial [Pseudolycoriella hygida]